MLELNLLMFLQFLFYFFNELFIFIVLSILSSLNCYFWNLLCEKDENWVTYLV